MAAPTLSSHILVWKKSSEVICMKDVLAGNPRRTVLGFQADKKFTQTVPKFTFDDPNEEEEDRVSKEKEKGKGKEKETPKKAAAKKIPERSREPDSGSDSNGEEEYEEPSMCIYCIQKKIKCESLDKHKFFDKTTWAIIDGSQKISESMWELLTLEKWCAASLLQRSWYELDICALNLEWAVDQDLMEVDGRVIKLLDLKSRGVEILAELEKQVLAN
ncbi:hypothetical protein M422DRAFT_254579 [Sphaerobolus stellatus SS14]|uniref:Unplaced genomic scaffold SPHSTscaffold_56, whole genome shotgun sequence n=1 Tax=Sphaerobolus stellatus (strain SS14) TaxID=990650 RepID=A0A0C9VKI2_SPHS4|nr:hypothetical protein M422DRAFT_254579 [Sphaerobolus stellatus SS14]